MTALLVVPADAKHRRHHKPLTPRVEQPLTPRVDQPLRSRSKQRLKTRGTRHIKPNQAQQETQGQQPSPAGVPVPESRPADEQKPDAAAAEKQKPEGPKTTGAPNQPNQDRLNEEKSRQGEQVRPEPSAPKPSADTESEPEPPAVVPIPTPKPDTAEPEAQPPPVAPQPPPKPADAGEKTMLPDPRSADLPDEKMPAEEVACRERLKTLGVDFEEHKAESNPEIGCSIPYPIVLKSLGKSVAIAPGTELNCPMAEAAARFAADVIQPAAKAEFGADLKSISQASAFVCRPPWHQETV
ncbi:extensin family protein [Mesorhizobium sp. PAMC28654]|uniref:extensin family protein n=1 Tax=Mesorhizobium sp. PAMC28654 TaxID=2880934 RepID=UPI0022227E5B|nr:extensin family protein [Mesorhizobium sp. PAMC28654]